MFRIVVETFSRRERRVRRELMMQPPRSLREKVSTTGLIRNSLTIKKCSKSLIIN